MHILITVNACWNVANFRRGLIKALLADGHRITVLAPRDEFSGQLAEMGCRVIPLKMDRKGISPSRDIGLVMRFLGHFRRERPDVILSYTIKNNIYGAFAARVLRIPFVPTVTGLGTAFLSGAILQYLAEILYRAAFSTAATVFFQNSDDFDFFVERGLVRRDQARLVAGSGIDLRRFTPSEVSNSGEAATFVMIGRILRDKGVIEYIEAARMIRERYSRASFLLLGRLDAENRGAIAREKVQEWQRDGTVSHLESVADVRPFIRDADCVVLPSYREGAPRTLLEASAMGRPVIASDVPGCRAVVENGVTGLLCDARSAESLRDALSNFIELPYLRRVEMGRAGRAKMEREFDEIGVIDVYRQAIGNIGAAVQAETNASSLASAQFKS